MNEQANGQLHVPSDAGSGPAGSGDAPRITGDKAKGKPGRRNEAVLGPFTVRDLAVFGSTLILFIASLVPMFALRYNLWNLGSLFFLGLGILLPLIVCALFVARRLSPGAKLRVGSLSVDQFASVVASFAVAFFFLAVAVAYVPTMLLALVGALGLFAATVLARFIPYLAGDFLDRAETPAHVAARDAAAPVRRPRAPKARDNAKPRDNAQARDNAKDVKDQGSGKETVSGWAKRIRPGGPAATPAPAQRDAEPRVPGADDAVHGTSGASSAGATAVPAGSPEPAAAQTDGAQTDGAQTAAAQTATTPHVVPSSGHGATATGGPAAALSGGSSAEAASSTAASSTAARAAAATPATADRAGSAAEETRAAEAPLAASASAPTAVNPQVRAEEPIGATVDPAQRSASNQPRTVQEAFWFAVAQPRTAVDEVTGAPAFVVEPGAWVLALEDRGTEFVVQHTDGRVGVLRDLSNIERG